MIEGPDPPAPLLVGQAPAARSEGTLLGASGRRLARLCSLSLEEYAARFARVNLVPEYPGPGSRGDAFPVARAREGWERLAPLLTGRSAVVLLGSSVAAVVGFAAPTWEWREVSVDGGPPFLVARAPHPSGVNPWWNDALGVLRAERWWRELARSRTP